MKRALPERVWSGRGLPVAIAALAFVISGCDSVPLQSLEPPAYYHPANVAVEGFALPVAIRRVAVLPLAPSSSSTALEQGVEALQPVVDSELKKTERFEVVTVSPEHLRDLTGQSAWRADEPLPIDFFRHLQRDTGCDAIMFCEITRYQPYQPLSVGWKLCLAAQGTAEHAEPRKLWSVDEVLDSGDSKTARAARTYYSQHIHNEQPSPDPATILRSPLLFGQFSLSALFSTIPQRSPD